MAVVENMSYFDADGTRYFPFGKGSGDRIQRDFGLPNLVRFPIMADLSTAGDGGRSLLLHLGPHVARPLISAGLPLGGQWWGGHWAGSGGEGGHCREEEG